MLGDRLGRSDYFSYSRVGHTLRNSFLLSIADSSLTKVLYRILMVKAVLLPRVNGVI